MAAGNITLFNQAKLKIHKGLIDFDNDTFVAVLTTSAQALSASFTGGSGFAELGDLTHEITGGGYYRVNLSGVTIIESAGVVTFDADEIIFPALTNTFKYLVVFDTTLADDDLILFCDLNTVGSVTTAGEDLELTPNASGLFTNT